MRAVWAGVAKILKALETWGLRVHQLLLQRRLQRAPGNRSVTTLFTTIFQSGCGEAKQHWDEGAEEGAEGRRGEGAPLRKRDEHIGTLCICERGLKMTGNVTRAPAGRRAHWNTKMRASMFSLSRVRAPSPSGRTSTKASSS